MPQHCPNAAAAIVAAEPDSSELPARPAEPAPVEVEVRHRGRLSSWLSMLSCCGKSSMSNSIHFHAQRVEDSVHVMIKHDKEACKKRGQPEKSYSPRAPLSERLAAAGKMEAARREASHATIEAREEDDDGGDDILAAVTRADCVS